MVDCKRAGSNVWNGIKATWEKVLEGLENINGDEHFRWKWGRDGCFSVKSAYTSLTNNNDEGEGIWGKIWKLKTSQRVKIFMWLVKHNRLLTNEARRKRGLSSSGNCDCCSNKVEDVLHVLRDCPSTKSLWQSLISPNVSRKFFQMNLNDWVSWNFKNNISRTYEDWSAWFAVTSWLLWHRRNERIISNENIISHAWAILRSMNEMKRKCSGINWSGAVAHETPTLWTRPKKYWAKMNVDGAYDFNSKQIGCGGILRNSDGGYITGSFHHMNEGDSLSAELWACTLGLKVAWDSGIRKLILESDSSEAIEWLGDGDVSLHPDCDVIQEARSLLHREWEVTIQQVRRHANTAADYLAKKALAAMTGFHSITVPPMELSGIMNMDLNKPP